MKMNSWIAVGALVLTSMINFSQDAQAQATLKQFTLEDLNFGGNNYHNMTSKTRFTTWWGDVLVRLDLDKCYVIDKRSAKETLLFTLDQVVKRVLEVML